MRRILLAAALALGACASVDPILTPINAAATTQTAPAPGLGVDDDVVALSFSGGGARAAAFSLGVLQGLRDTPAAQGGTLLDRVALITSVSGGSITAAYYGQHGAPGLDTFRAAYLDKDWQAELHLSPLWPANWVRFYRGGLNDRDLLGDWLDAEVFAGATMADLYAPGRPRIWINATELYHGVPFAFTPPYFQAICGDLPRVRIADAVAASMSVPVAFRPILVEPHPDACGPLPDWIARASQDRGAPSLLRATAQAFQTYRNPERMRYLHLVDGGVTDNFGLAALMVQRHAATTPFGPLSERDAVRVRRLVFLVVNAEIARSGTWPMHAEGPNAGNVLSAAADASLDFGKRVSYDAFVHMIGDWQETVRSYRCHLTDDEVLRWRGTLEGWDCDDVSFTVDLIGFPDLGAEAAAALSEAPTRVNLPSEQIDALIAGGREAIRLNAAAQSLSR